MVTYAASIGDQFTDLLGRVVDVAVKVVIFLAILAIGWLVGKWLYRWLTKLLRRLGFDRAVERGGLSRVMGSNSPSDLAAKLIVAAFLLLALQLAFGIFGPNPVSDLIHSVVAWLPKLFVAIVIVVVVAAISGWIKEFVSGALGGVSYGRAVATAAQVLVLAVGVIAAVNQIGVAVTVTLPILVGVLATIAGVIVVGVGGGLIRPMQHRWERILNRVEIDSGPAADKYREYRAQRAAAAAAQDRDANTPGGFEQPAYGGKPSSAKPADHRSPDTKPAGTNPPDGKPSDSRPSDSRPSGAKPAGTGETPTEPSPENRPGPLPP
jgi:hypothetical protein